MLIINHLKETTNIIRVQRPATSVEIRDAEATLGVSFPPVYIEMLRRYGVVRVYDNWIAGLGPYAKPRSRTRADVVRLTEMARRVVGLPEQFVAISEDQHYDFTCLDTSRVQRGDCPVVYLNIEMVQVGNNIPRQIFPAFEAWVRDFAQKQVEKKRLLERECPGLTTNMGGLRRNAAIRRWKEKRRRK